jgi:hypothetical protein
MPSGDVPPWARSARAGAGMRRIRARRTCRPDHPGPGRRRHATHARTPGMPPGPAAPPAVVLLLQPCCILPHPRSFRRGRSGPSWSHVTREPSVPRTAALEA